MLRMYLQHLGKTPSSLRKLGLMSAMILLFCAVTFSQPAFGLVLCPKPAAADTAAPKWDCPAKGLLQTVYVAHRNNCPKKRCRCLYLAAWSCNAGVWVRAGILDIAEVCEP
jgi:hypothetical protein